MKDKNPLSRLLAFDAYTLVNDISKDAQYLWIRLFIISVRNFQPLYIELSNAKLSSILDCTTKTARRIRDELVEKNLLDYENKGTRQNGVYKIKFPFENDTKNGKDYGKIYPNNDPNSKNDGKDYGKIYPNKDDYGNIYPNNDPNRTLQVANTNALESSQIRKEVSCYSNINNNNYILSTTTDNNWIKFMSLYEKNIAMFPHGIELEKLSSYYDDFGLEVMLYAIEYVAAKQAISPHSYLNAVLKSWAKKELKTLADIKADVAKHNRSYGARSSPEYGVEDEKIKKGESPF